MNTGTSDIRSFGIPVGKNVFLALNFSSTESFVFKYTVKCDVLVRRYHCSSDGGGSFRSDTGCVSAVCRRTRQTQVKRGLLRVATSKFSKTEVLL